MRKTAITLLVLLPLPFLTGCKDTPSRWDGPTRTAAECYEDRSNTPCLVVGDDETSGMLYQKDKTPLKVRMLWHEEDGTWKFADDLRS